MDTFLLLQWLLFGGLALVWMPFCGANLLVLFFVDPYWLAWFATPLDGARTWLQRR